MAVNPIRARDGGVRVDVLVVPNASRSVIVGPHGDRIKIRVSAPPERGKANKELTKLLKDATGAAAVDVVLGSNSRRKTVDLCGVRIDAVAEALAGG